MTAKIFPLEVNGALANDNEAIATRLEQLAADIRAGEHGDVMTVISIIEPRGAGIRRRVYGQRIDQARGTGILFMAAHRMACGADREDDEG